jgi:hypothetical protein
MIFQIFNGIFPGAVQKMKLLYSGFCQIFRRTVQTVFIGPPQMQAADDGTDFDFRAHEAAEFDRIDDPGVTASGNENTA